MRITIETEDNKTKEKDSVGDLSEIANVPLNEIILDKTNLLVFPQNWDGGITVDSPIFNYYHNKIKTNNIMGFIGKEKTEMIISSRFDDNKKNYFLHYMLQKVFNLNIVNLNISKGEENIHDFLPYLFPGLLLKALSQGLFKQYKRIKYNDSNVKEVIDINRHIRVNIPFAGKIAYTTREHSRDNPVTQLVRHTIEYLRTRPFGLNILTNNPDIRTGVSLIEYATPGYKKGNLEKVISANRLPVNHPYFIKYRPLQRLCLQILRKKNTNVGKEDELHGLLFDGAWLWEEYLNKLFFEKKLDFNHAENKTGKKPIYLFENNKKTYDRYPDFYKDNFILDAKYKPLDGKSIIDREDIHQIITYMHIKKAKLGGFIFPSEEEIQSENPKPIGTLNGYGGEIKTWRLTIPKKELSTFEEFKGKIQKNETKLIGKLKLF